MFTFIGLLRLHNPSILILVDTKVSSVRAQQFMQWTMPNRIVGVEARGFLVEFGFFEMIVYSLEVLSVQDQI